MTVDLLIRNAYIYVDRDWEIADGWIAIEGGRIHAIGSHAEEPPPSVKTISAHGQLITPGLINAHHHMYQNLTRAYAPVTNGTLFEWLTGLYPLWAELNEDSVYLSTFIAMVELLMGGCTTSMDHMYVHPKPFLIDAQFKAAQEIGFRFHATRGSMTRSVKDGGLPPVSVVQDEETILEDSERLVAKFHDASAGSMGRVALAPCSLFSVSERIMTESARMSEKHELRLHTHLAEDPDEDTYCAEIYGCTPTEYFERVGWANHRSWVAHYIYPSKDEIDRLAHAGVCTAQCPCSNMMIGGGSADAMDMRRRGMKVGLGCDGSASTDHASMWLETRMALLLGRYRNGPHGMTARDALDMATRGGAACLGWEDEIGHLRPGACADLVVWKMSEIALAGALSDPIEAWLRCAPAIAGTTIVNGRILVEEGVPLIANLGDILKEHSQHARRIQKLLP
ncbi:8-oxoguanine deaminase [Gluconobacter wancherniae]|uniref:8-oxoguanine deaminase n=1 Tax=Gluconobacter wancherniae NBRC 103581 TaxID=656744 RepID=A0A511AY61_9PROT|nr:8-oxoguanine deaminase [Gluconobacter wancherniae]MBF0852462.1 8-oxoguanine deaminase [Gluconobacter wancherniae]GBD56829.1 8-oxoguanine deaminase [Gluconobacter wancherniae NBRC 103581]GBR64624.1 hydroxydechloroatrazine ethylaminohydrolase [Gluconobacter wancherniae NBRC 103581]GEK92263.1 8-oxoguanine deaminase [Gluconobacter wancherniae NBRC 103581]